MRKMLRLGWQIEFMSNPPGENIGYLTGEHAGFYLETSINSYGRIVICMVDHYGRSVELDRLISYEAALSMSRY